MKIGHCQKKLELLNQVRSPSGYHTAYKREFLPKKVKVHYFLHPAYESEVVVLDKRDFGTEKYYIIKFFDNIMYLPEWMTRTEDCQCCRVQDQPQCSIRALQALRSLLDSIEIK